MQLAIMDFLLGFIILFIYFYFVLDNFGFDFAYQEQLLWKHKLRSRRSQLRGRHRLHLLEQSLSLSRRRESLPNPRILTCLSVLLVATLSSWRISERCTRGTS